MLPTSHYSWKLTLILYPLFCTVCFVYAPAHHHFLFLCKWHCTQCFSFSQFWNLAHDFHHWPPGKIDFSNSQKVDSRQLPPEYDNYPNSLFARMLLSSETWMTWWTFVPSAVEKYWKINILFYVKGKGGGVSLFICDKMVYCKSQNLLWCVTIFNVFLLRSILWIICWLTGLSTDHPIVILWILLILYMIYWKKLLTTLAISWATLISIFLNMNYIAQQRNS